MAPPPIPPPTNPQPTPSAAHNRPHSRRHAQHRPPSPEEPLAPANSRRKEGSAPPAVGTAVSGPPTTSDDGTRGGKTSNGAQEEPWLETKLQNSSRKTTSAGNEAAGGLFPAAGTGKSGDLGPVGRWIREEGTEGFKGLVPDPSTSSLPDNGTPMNFATFKPVSAHQVIDEMPERDSNTVTGLNVRLEDGEVWEKGLETIERAGSSVRAIFSANPQGVSSTLHGAGLTEQPLQMKQNAVNTQHSGMKGTDPIESDAPTDNLGRHHYAPDRAVAAAGQVSSCRHTVQSVTDPDFRQLHEVGIPHSVGSGDSSRALWRVDSVDYTSRRAGGEGEARGPYSGGVKIARLLADCSQNQPDSALTSSSYRFASRRTSAKGPGRNNSWPGGL